MKNVPEQISRLKQLRDLYLNNNQISVLPKQLCDMTQLTVLDLSYNRLIYLPPSIARLTNLQMLNLANNTELCVPDVLRHGHSLDCPVFYYSSETYACEKDRIQRRLQRVQQHYSAPVREAVYVVLLARTRFDNAFSSVPKDVVKLLAKYVWNTRNDHMWSLCNKSRDQLVNMIAAITGLI